MENRQMWKFRMTFILAAIGSAVGLGNAWRFPGLAAKHGGHLLWAQIAAGWVVSGLVFISGFVIKLIVKHKKKNGYVEDEVVWQDD